ncbi:zinc-binding domain-containing protein [Cladorrhinum samala]|uniref:Zinc-binding domain-containing protein n=1 Tax=Cladorrhinum samala TaxID=585594 RepID=A0AAV9HCB6_9PEZI|nr:zinc-binding domain-containing protein [Cladorrhinum samala]
MPPKSKKGKSKTGPITQAGPRPRATPPHTLSAAYIFPGLHYKIITALSGDCVADSALPYFNLAGTDREATDTYDTTIQADFQCINQSCSEFEWSSKIVGIEILKFGDNTYNATIFNQRCKACDALGYLRLEEDSYVARVVYRLKKWAGVKMEEQPYNPCRGGPVHASELCEGCKVGKCKYATNFEEDY